MMIRTQLARSILVSQLGGCDNLAPSYLGGYLLSDSEISLSRRFNYIGLSLYPNLAFSAFA